jgi:hypothetical protein
MQFRINPAFRRFPAEAGLVGHILASFGEIELTICRNAAISLNRLNTIMKALYSLNATSQRIQVADQLMRPEFEASGLAAEYNVAIKMVWHCVKIRNAYAHCNWADDEKSLFYADLQDSADTPDFDHYYLHVDVPLLEKQEAFLGQTMEHLEWLYHEIAVRQSRLQSHAWPKPQELGSVLT